MRAIVFPLLLMSALLAGCLGGDNLDDEDAVEIETVPALRGAIQTDAVGTWLEPGEAIDVSVTPPADAVGEVRYTWLIQEDPFTIFSESRTIDTGDLAPGQTGNLTFSDAGFYEYGHCDPHPWMKHTVAVLDGYDGPDHLDVYIVEGDLEDQQSWAFVPEHITVKTGATVTYHNLGQVGHTASVAHKGEAVPVPRTLGLTEAAGTVTVEGSDWMNLVVIFEDEAGTAGYAKQPLFVRAKFADTTETFTGSEPLVWPEALGAPPDELLNTTAVYELGVDWKGTLTVDVDVADPTGLLNEVRVTVREKAGQDAVPNPQVIHESDPMVNGSFSVDLGRPLPDLAIKYEIVVTPVFGILLDYTIGATVVYDHTPPELVRLPCPEPHYSQGHC